MLILSLKKLTWFAMLRAGLTVFKKEKKKITSK